MVNTFESGSGGRKEVFSADFITRAKAAFPNEAKLLGALDAGNTELVGLYLDGVRDFDMDPEDIVKAFAEGRQDEVLEAAKKSEEGSKLWAEYMQSQRN